MTASPNAERCACQTTVSEFFQLLASAPSVFFDQWLDDASGDCLVSLSSLAVNELGWTAVLVDLCLADLLNQTSTREDVFRQDLAATRCLKAVVGPAFTAATRSTLTRAIARLVGKETGDISAHASRLLQRLAFLSLPPVVRFVARKVFAAFEGKFNGAGRTALVGLFWLRLLCPLLIKLGGEVVPSSKSSKMARVIELVKLLQTQANIVGTAEQQGSQLTIALDALLADVDDWPPQRPSLPVLHAFSGWLVAHSLQLGRTLKTDKQLFETFTRCLSAMHDLSTHQHSSVEPDAQQALPSTPRSSSLSSFSFFAAYTKPSLRMPRLPARSSSSCETLSNSTDDPLSSSSLSSSQDRHFAGFAATSITPVKAEQKSVPLLFTSFQPERSLIEAWTAAEVAQWLTTNQLHELVDPFRTGNIDGKQVLMLSRRSAVFTEHDIKIGVVHRFLNSQRALHRATISVFNNGQFESEAEQILTMKEFIVRLAQHFNGAEFDQTESVRL